MSTVAFPVSADRRQALLMALERVGLAVIPPAIFVVLLVTMLSHADSAIDFRFAYWTAGHQLLTGNDPYMASSAQIRLGEAFVYPPLAAVVFAPLALVSDNQASVVVALSWALLPAAVLWILRMRDWRVYSVTLLWPALFSSVQTANVTILLVLLTACAWRWRDRPWVTGLIVAAAVSTKPFMWPLALWLLATGRWKATGWALAWALALNLVTWAIVGFGDIGPYLHDSAVDVHDAWRSGLGLAVVAGDLGLNRSAADAAAALVSLGLVAAVTYAGAVKHSERGALTLAVVLMLAASPLVWRHYFALLLVPLAIYRPRLDWIWGVPVLMWVCPPNSRVHLWQVVVDWLVIAVMTVALVRDHAGAPSRSRIAVPA